MSLPDYEVPPLTEVVFGLSFQNIPSFKVPHIGSYWTEIREEYPKCEQRPPFSPPASGSNEWPIPLPLIWFISEDYSHLIQLQNGYFYLNWRKQNDQMTYPRFVSLIENYFEKLSGFISFLEKEELENINFTSFELTYINHIYYNHLMPSPLYIGNVFPDLEWKFDSHEALPEPTPHARYDFELPENAGSMSIEIKHGKRNVDNVPLYVLEISVQGNADNSDLESARAWYNSSHEWIIKSFADITSQKAQYELWKRMD